MGVVDSVFSPIIAQFQDEEPIPYADDEPILPRKEIEKALDSKEERYSNLLVTVGFSSTDSWWKSIEPALEKGDKEYVEKTPWTLSPNYQQLLFGLWTDTWDLGCFHAVKGLNIANQQAADEDEDPSDFNQHSALTTFADVPLPDYPQQPFYTAYPPNYGYPLRDTDLRSAVEQRTIFLADDVNQKTRDRIQKAVLEAVSQHGESGIPKRDRVKLLAQINLALGRQSLDEIKDPNVAIGDKLVRTKLQVPGTQSFVSRSKTIAATEVSAGYSLGRLQVYTQAGVKRVRWQSLEDLRVCKLCRTRNGIIIEADILLSQHQFAFRQKADPTQLIIPCHPNDRCFWVGLVERKKKDRDMIADPGRQMENREVQPLRGGWNTLKNAIGLTLTIASAVRTGARVVEEVQQQQRLAEQQREQQKQEEARRLARTLMVTGGAALSLGLLYMIMRNQQQQRGTQPSRGTGVSPIQPLGPQPVAPIQPTGIARPLAQQAASYLNRQQQIQQVKAQPVTPAQILTEPEQQRTLAKLPAGLDLRTISKEALRGLYGLTIAEAQMVEKLRKQYERDRITPPEQALVPQFFLPPNLLNQYPKLKEIGNLRDLSLKDLARIILGAKGQPAATPDQLQETIQQQVQDVLALPPAQLENPPGQLMVGGTNLNTASIDEIARLLPAGMSLKRRQAIARTIYNALRQMSALGTPITSLDELAAVPGVGAITVRNLQSRNYTQNLNNLLLQLGDKDAADAIAGLLDIGPKLASEIVREFREGGQFGSPGIDPVEGLIERVSKRVAKNRNISFSEETKNRIRERLSGRMYIMPIPATQPINAIQAQGVGGALPPATSPLETPPPSQPLTPRIPGSPPAPQLPPGSPQAPIITPTSSLGFPSRVQPTIQNTVIPVTSAEANQQSRRDTALDNYGSLSSQTENYEADLTEAVNEGRMPKVGLMGGGLKMHKYRDKLFKQAQDSIKKTITTVAGTEVNAASLDQLATSAEQIVSDLESRLQDIDDPLADPLFRDNGELVAEARSKIKDARANINQGLAIIDNALGIPDTLQQELQKRKGELNALRDRALVILNSLDPSAKNQLGSSLDSEIQRLQALRPEQLGSYYAEVQELIAQHQELRNRVLDVERSAAIKAIDGQIAAIDDVIQNASNLQRPELVDSLTQARARLVAANERINRLPRTFDELSPPQQQGFVSSQAMRDRIRGTSLSVERNLAALRKRVDKSQGILDSTLDAYSSAITPLQTPGSSEGETFHDGERRQGNEYIQNLINLSVQGINTEMQNLRRLADPVTGMAQVLGAIKSTDALGDVPALPSAPVAPGLQVPTPQPADETIRGRLLDDAVKERRNQINRTAARITSNATLASGFPYAYVQRIQSVLDPTTPNGVPHPDSVTRSRLSSVNSLIQTLTEARESAYTEIQELANAVAADLDQLRTLDPVAYQEVRMSPTWVTIQQLRANAASQVSEYDNRITALQNAASQLNTELRDAPRYNYNGQQLTPQEIRDRLDDVKREVGRLIQKRRDDLTPIWNKFAPLTTVDSSGLEAAYKGQKAPTPDEQEFINNLTPAEQKTLRDAANTGALDLFRRRVRLVTKEQELTVQKAQLWGDPSNPEKIKGRQVPRTILKNLEQFNKKLRKQAGMKIILVDNPSEARIDYQVVDLYDESAPNYQAEPGFKDYAGQPGVQKSLQRSRRRLVADGLIDEFEQAPWVQETLGLLVEGEARTVNWRQYVDAIENQRTPSQVPTNYVEVMTALELVKARRVQIEGEMEVVGFKRRMQSLVKFKRRVGARSHESRKTEKKS